MPKATTTRPATEPLPLPARPSWEEVARLRLENARLRKELETLLRFRQMALTDELTGVPNRRLCAERLTEELDVARCCQQRCVSVLVVDLDDFKTVNDQYGHRAGDEVLRQVARQLAAALRTFDVCCRTGGDEFTIILPNTPAAECTRVLERIQREFAPSSNPNTAIGSSRAVPRVSASIGAATFGVDGQTTAELLDVADRRMYRIKRRHHAMTRRWTEPPCSSAPMSVAAA